jgi:hypothetical protein
VIHSHPYSIFHFIPLPLYTPTPTKQVAESEKAVAKITDEFKRYRVKSEILRKQKDAEAKQASSISIQAQRRQIHGELDPSSSSSSSGDSMSSNNVEKKLMKAEAQIDTLMEEMAEKVFRYLLLLYYNYCHYYYYYGCVLL